MKRILKLCLHKCTPLFVASTNKFYCKNVLAKIKATTNQIAYFRNLSSVLKFFARLGIKNLW